MEQFFDDVRKRFTLNEEDDYILRKCVALNGMSLSRMVPNTRTRIMRMMKATALNIVNDNEGKLRDLVFSDEYYIIYRNAFPGLLELIEKYEDADWPPQIRSDIPSK